VAGTWQKPKPVNFRARYSALERRREDLLARLAILSKATRKSDAHIRARTLLSTTFRKASLAQRAAILDSADWLLNTIELAAPFL
jgi:hypothetical protein